jgi:hypothetical protein
VESLQPHCIHTQFHWSSGPPICFLSWGSWVQSPGGYLSDTRDLLLVFSRYIGDPDVIDHCGLVWGGLHPKPSLGRRADNVIIPLDLTQLSCPSFTLAEGPPSGLTIDIVGCWGGALWRAYNLIAFIHSSTFPVVHPFASCHEGSISGYLCETRILLLALSCYTVIFINYNSVMTYVKNLRFSNFENF